MFADSPTYNQTLYAAVVALAWIAKELLTMLKGKKKSLADLSTGETLPSYWEKQFDDTRRLIVDAKTEQVTATRELIAAINTLTITILKGK